MGSAADDSRWVTFDCAQSRSLLSPHTTEFIRPIGERDLVGVGFGIADARRIINKHRVDAVVSTGSAIALSFLPYAAVRGIPAYYIESAARVQEASLTGRLLEKVPGVRVYRQYPQAAKGRWRYIGSVFDGYEARDGGQKAIKRIVVTLGGGTHPFRRLVERLVRTLPSSAEVIWQTGSTPTAGLGIKATQTMPAAQLAAAIEDAEVVIAHAGCGSALTALNAGKYPIIVPRERRFGELVDDHQVELARFLEGRDLALYRTPETIDLDDLEAAAARRTSRRANPPAIELN